MPANARPKSQPKPEAAPGANTTITLPPVTLGDIRNAADAIAGQVMRTPMRQSRTLSAIAGCEVWLKFENLQFTASFKERGALNKLLSLTEAERAAGVIAMSAGNHAQGVAYHAARLGIPATIVMPKGTPFNKIQHTQDHGARVLIEGEVLSEAAAFAEKICREEGLTFVPPYDDARIIAGQGTVALEMLEKAPDLDTMIIPIGGGGLISGMAIAAKAINPKIEIHGVQTALYPSMYRAIKGETGISGGATVAEGIAVQHVAERTRAIIAALVTDMVLVDEAALEHAVALLLEVEKTVVEGAAAAGLAALMGNRERFAGRKVGLVLTAGNIDSRLLASVILRELSRGGRISVFHVELTDRPGSLAKVSSIIGDAGGNIIEVMHNRLSTAISAKNAVVDIMIETRDGLHRDSIAEKIAAAGFPFRIVEA
ncbi:MAG TPA: threonine ammonia-lyase [Alphaproteobacteria bacterium]|nr:threonine ammonia-lyase [Alphaproteobacteria bacterium]